VAATVVTSPLSSSTLSADTPSRPRAPSCSVVIATRDRPALLTRCLDALERLTYPRFHVLVVDNAPATGETRDIALQRGVGYAVEPTPGLSRARNLGAHLSDADIVAFLDDDSLPAPDWLSNLVREFDDPMVMAVAGRICPLSLETKAERLYSSMRGSYSGREKRSVDGRNPLWFELANFGGIGSGGNMAVRRSVLNVWSGFRENLGLGAPLHGAEEHHAFFSLIRDGYRVAYTPDAVVNHPYPKTFEQLRSRHVKNLERVAGYVTLLLVEEPRYWRRTIKYALGLATRRPRSWREEADSRSPRLLPRRRMIAACVSGMLLYARSRIAPSR
jgi:O-antigen biosynthesis protein